MAGCLTGAVADRQALHAYSVLRTADLDEACRCVTQVLSPHDLRIVRRAQRLDAHMCHAPLGRISINRLRYGATVGIDVGCTDDFVLIMMPLVGVADIRCGDESIRSTPALASVISPTLPLRMQSRDNADQIMVRIDRELIERYCAQHLGRELRHPVEFRIGMDLSGGGGASWGGLIRYLVAELDRQSNVFATELTRVHVEQLVVSTLLFAQPHGYHEELARPARPVAPRYVKRVEEFIEAHAREALTIGDLAAHAGVSASTLFAGFREHRKTTPMAHLRRVRLQCARHDMQTAAPASSTVTDVALRWGFTHLGRFAADYKRWFGESPSATLRH